MKRRKTRTEITTETERSVVLRLRRTSVLSHCQICGKAVTLVPLEDAAIMSGSTLASVYRKLQAGEIHGQEINGGPVMICEKSLFQAKRS